MGIRRTIPARRRCVVRRAGTWRLRERSDCGRFPRGRRRRKHARAGRPRRWRAGAAVVGRDLELRTRAWGRRLPRAVFWGNFVEHHRTTLNMRPEPGPRLMAGLPPLTPRFLEST